MTGSWSTKPISTHRPARLVSGEPGCGCLPLTPFILTIAISVSGRAGGFPESARRWRTFAVPRGAQIPARSYFLFHGSLSEAEIWGPPAEAGIWGRPEFSRRHPRVRLAVDRTWCVAADIDPHWAGIGASLLSIKRLIAAELDSRSHESPRPSTMSDTKHQTVSLGLNAATSSSLASAWMRNLIRGRVSAGLQSALVGETAAAPGGDGGECAR